MPTFAGMLLAIIKYCFYQKDQKKGSSALQILNSVEMRPKIPQVVDAEVGRGRRQGGVGGTESALHRFMRYILKTACRPPTPTRCPHPHYRHLDQSECLSKATQYIETLQCSPVESRTSGD